MTHAGNPQLQIALLLEERQRLHHAIALAPERLHRFGEHDGVPHPTDLREGEESFEKCTPIGVEAREDFLGGAEKFPLIRCVERCGRRDEAIEFEVGQRGGNHELADVVPRREFVSGNI